MFLSIDWNPDPVLFKIGSFEIRYYSLMFVLAFTLGLEIMKRIFKNENVPLEKLDSLFIYVVVGTLFGARIGHFLFYDPEFLFTHPLEVLLPIKFNPLRFVGFAGLASHGAAIGIITAMYIYSKRVYKQPLLVILDRLVIPTALGAVFVRIGNLMNSEIIGKATGTDYGFIFKKLGEDFPRHPAQLYEAMGYLMVFVILWYLYWKTDKKDYKGYLFGVFFVLLWTVRFIVEFFKEAQVDERAEWALNTGQWLSIPLIVIGFYFIKRSKGHKKQ